MKKYRLLVSILGALFWVILFFLSGYDFDFRGEKAVFCFVFSVATFVGIISFPGWE